MKRRIKKWLRFKFGRKEKRCNFCGIILSYKEKEMYGCLCENCEILFLEKLKND